MLIIIKTPCTYQSIADRSALIFIHKFIPYYFLQKQFKRTDSNDSNNSSLASFGLSILSRNNSKKNQLKRQVDRMDSDISRGFVMPPSSLATVSSPPLSSTEVVEVEDVKRDEVAIVVGSRKNSATKAVR